MSLYRKYRPQTLAEVIGQDQVVTVLSSALAQGRVAHAYLFSGPRGTGKTSVARIMAKALNCLEPTQTKEPCNKCANCLAINAGAYLDVVEIDAASHRRVEEARQLIEQVTAAASMGGYKVYILDEVHMLTTEAFNTLLKTLEEPPKGVVFMLCTTEPHKVPVTIASRCQRLVFHRANATDLHLQLGGIAAKEGMKVDEAALARMAELADGGFRDAAMLLEQLGNHSGQTLTEAMVVEQLGLAGDEVVVAMATAMVEDKMRLIEMVEDFLLQGGETRYLLSSLLQLFRQMLLAVAAPDLAKKTIEAGRLGQVERLGGLFGQTAIVGYLSQLLDLDKDQSNLSGLRLEVVLMGAGGGLAAEVGSQEHVSGGGVVTASEQVTGPTATSLGAPKAANLGASKAVTGQAVPVMEAEPLPQPPAEIVAETVAAEPGGGQESVKTKAEGQAAERVEPVQPAAPVPANAPAELLEAWGKIVVQTTQKSRSLGALLKDCTPLSYDGTLLVLQFWYDFHKRRIESDKNRPVLEEIAGQVLGSKVKLRCQLGDISRRPRRQPMGEEDIRNVSEAEESELLDAASKIFGGEIV